MLLTLSLVILGCAFIVFFSQEIAKIIKKCIERPLLGALIPIFLVSLFLFLYEHQLYLALWYLKWFLHTLITNLERTFPLLAKFLPWLFIFSLSMLPLVITWALQQRRLPYAPLKFNYWISFLIWIFLVILYTVKL